GQSLGQDTPQRRIARRLSALVHDPHQIHDLLQAFLRNTSAQRNLEESLSSPDVIEFSRNFCSATQCGQSSFWCFTTRDLSLVNVDFGRCVLRQPRQPSEKRLDLVWLHTH